MATFEIPDDMARFLEEEAPTMAKADGRALLLSLIDQLRTRKRDPHRESMAPESYLKGSKA